MSRSTEITGLKGKDRLAAAVREKSYPLQCLCWGTVGLVLARGRAAPGGGAPAPPPPPPGAPPRPPGPPRRLPH